MQVKEHEITDSRILFNNRHLAPNDKGATPHYYLLENVETILCEEFDNVKSSFVLSPNGKTCTIKFTFPYQWKGDQPTWNLFMGVVNSNNDVIGRVIYGGLVLGDAFVPFLRETIHGNTPIATAKEMARNLKERCHNVNSWLSPLTSTVLSYAETCALLCSAARGTNTQRTSLMPWSRVGDVDKLLSECAEITLFDVINAFACVAKCNPAVRRWEQTYRFVSMCYGLTNKPLTA